MHVQQEATQWKEELPVVLYPHHNHMSGTYGFCALSKTMFGIVLLTSVWCYANQRHVSGAICFLQEKANPALYAENVRKVMAR